ncbi:MAG: hypothetical protein ABL866_02170 [Devosia sp.]
MDEARNLRPASATAAFIFAIASVEIGLQDLLLKPVVAGFVHDEDMSEVLVAVIDLRNATVWSERGAACSMNTCSPALCASHAATVNSPLG